MVQRKMLKFPFRGVLLFAVAYISVQGDLTTLAPPGYTSQNKNGFVKEDIQDSKQSSYLREKSAGFDRVKRESNNTPITDGHEDSSITKELDGEEKAVIIIGNNASIVQGKGFPEKSCGGIEGSQPTRTKENLLKYLTQINGSKTISGIFAGTSLGPDQSIKAIQNIAGVLPGVVSLMMPTDTSRIRIPDWKELVKEVISIWKDGSIVVLHWHWQGFGPLVSMDIFTSYEDSIDKETKWANLIQDDGPVNKIWKEQLDIIAPHLKKLQDAGVFSIFDIFPYTNRRDFIWRGRPGLNGTALLYKITHDYLTKHHNLTSLIWSWTLDSKNMYQFENYWPGDEYVDVASVNMWDKKELRQYERLLKVVGDKPISMEDMRTVPTPEVLAAQPRWTWFTVTAVSLPWGFNTGSSIEIVNKINATFHSISVVNRGDIDFFKTKEQTENTCL